MAICNKYDAAITRGNAAPPTRRKLEALNNGSWDPKTDFSTPTAESATPNRPPPQSTPDADIASPADPLAR